MAKGKILQNFINDITKIAEQQCGEQFSVITQSIRDEREQLLNSVWDKERMLESPDSSIKLHIFREIDFDTILTYSANYLGRPDYLNFLFTVAEQCLKYLEFDKAERLFNLLLIRYKDETVPEMQAKVHHRLGKIYFYKTRLDLAVVELGKSLKLFNKIGDTEGVATVTVAQGILSIEQNEIGRGEILLQEARAIAEKEKYSNLLTTIDMNLGNLYHLRGDWDLAMEHFQRVINVASKTGNDDTLARVYNSIAIIYKSTHQYADALEHIRKSVAIADKISNQYLKGLSYLVESEVLCFQGDYSAATAILTTAFSIFSEVGDRLSMAEAYKIFGMINRQQRHYDIAFSFFENSMRINGEYENLLNLGETYVELAEAQRQDGELLKADESLKSAIECFKKIKAVTRIKHLNSSKN